MLIPTQNNITRLQFFYKPRIFTVLNLQNCFAHITTHRPPYCNIYRGITKPLKAVYSLAKKYNNPQHYKRICPKIQRNAYAHCRRIQLLCKKINHLIGGFIFWLRGKDLNQRPRVVVKCIYLLLTYSLLNLLHMIFCFSIN